MQTPFGHDRRRRLSADESRFLYERANGLCQRCGIVLDSRWHQAHLVSYTHGGATSVEQMEAWRSFKDGLGSYNFLPGEFDYFLSQRGIRREDVMKLPDVKIKAELESHMDERRTGENDYRRPVIEARDANPQRPGQPIEPFGYTQSEAKALVSHSGSGGTTIQHREALGSRVRRFGNTGSTTNAKSELLPVAERVRRSAMRLSDDDLADLLAALKQEQQRRKRAG